MVIGGCRLVRPIPICCNFVLQLKYIEFGDGTIQANISEKSGVRSDCCGMCLN